MTERAIDHLRHFITAELQLPAPVILEPDGKGGLASPNYAPPTGFMNKFVASYQVRFHPHPDGTHTAPWDAGGCLAVRYEHGGWATAGSNGVDVTLFHHTTLGWMTADQARDLDRAARKA